MGVFFLSSKFLLLLLVNFYALIRACKSTGFFFNEKYLTLSSRAPQDLTPNSHAFQI